MSFISGLAEEWKSLTDWCKRLLVIVIIQTILLVLFSIVVMCLDAASIPGQTNSDYMNKEIAYGLLVIVSSFFFLYFAFDGVMNENKFEMTAFGLVSVLLTVRIIFMFATYFKQMTDTTLWGPLPTGLPNDPYFLAVTWLTCAVMVVVIIFQVLLAILFVRSWRDFGWKLYKTVGANKNLIAYFRHYQIFLSLLKIDLQFGISLVLLAGFFLFDAASSVALWLNVAVIVVSVLWAILGWQSIIRELRAGMVIFFLFTVAEPAYIVYKVLSFYLPGSTVNCVVAPCILFTFSGAIAVIGRVALVVYAIQCFRNFDRGMKRVFGTDGQPAATATNTASTSMGPVGASAAPRPGSAAISTTPRASSYAIQLGPTATGSSSTMAKSPTFSTMPTEIKASKQHPPTSV